MHAGALRALEFDRIVEAVRGFALTPMGAERLARLAPSTDPPKVAQLLASTTETTKYLAANAQFPLAIETAQQALALANKSNKPALAREIAERLKRYQDGQSFIDESLASKG